MPSLAIKNVYCPPVLLQFTLTRALARLLIAVKPAKSKTSLLIVVCVCLVCLNAACLTVTLAMKTCGCIGHEKMWLHWPLALGHLPDLPMKTYQPVFCLLNVPANLPMQTFSRQAPCRAQRLQSCKQKHVTGLQGATSCQHWGKYNGTSY